MDGTLRAVSRGLWILWTASALACSGPRTPQSEASRSPYAAAPDPNEGPPKDVVAVKAPWTDSFMQPAVLLATEVRIEGPNGLLEHLATRADPEFHDRTEKAVPAGLMQEITVKPGAGESEIKAYLDHLAIAATRRLIVLERHDAVDVVVLAAGDAFWKNSATQEEQRGESLRFVGKIER